MVSTTSSLLNVKIVLSYEGTHYLGWQKTKMGPSVEEALEKALFQIYHVHFHIQAASRTDAGVHAQGQVVNVFLPFIKDIFRLQKGLNALLPSDIRVISLEIMPSDFHPTLNAVGKQYLYFVCNRETQFPVYRNFSWRFPYALDLEAMQSAALYFLGEHDFSAFCNLRTTDGRRTITSIDITPLAENRFKFSIEGTRFLYKMVRNIVGTLVYVGCKKLLIKDIPSIIQSRDRKNAGMTAPAHGLTLAKVFYSCRQEMPEVLCLTTHFEE